MQSCDIFITEAAAKNEDWNDRGGTKDRGYAIPLLMQNKVPEGYETDDKLNVELRAEEVYHSLK